MKRQSDTALDRGTSSGVLPRWKRRLLIVCGTLCVALAVIGMFLPVLPTTPFLLLAAYCYGRSSQKFLTWLLTNRIFGEYIKNYREGKGIPLKHKILTIAALWATIGYAAGIAVSIWWLRVLLVGIAVGVTVHLVRVKTYRPERQAAATPAEYASQD